MEIRGTVVPQDPNVTPPPASDDATLTGLKVIDGSRPPSNLTLTPTFVSSTLAYSASVGNAVDEVTVTVTKNHARAAITFFDGDDKALVDANTLAGGFQVGSLAVGANTIKVKVTAEDGTTTRTYTVTVTRETAVPSDVTAPFVEFPGVINTGTEVVLPFGEVLNWVEGSEDQVAAAFTLLVEGAGRDINTLEWRTELQVAGGALVLTPASVIYKGQTVVVSYDKSIADRFAIVDLADNELESFTTGSGGVDAVTNFSTVPSVSAPTNFTAGVGNAQVTLSWDAPASDSDITRHEYRFKTTGGYPKTWTQIPDSGVGDANEDGHTVTGLTNEVAHTFQLRAVKDGGFGTAAKSDPVTPTPGICDRTARVQTEILAKVAGVSECAAVTVANLATVTELRLENENITALKEGDFAGLAAVTYISLNGNDSLGALPANLFSGLASLTTLDLTNIGLTTVPAGLFSGLSELQFLWLARNAVGSLPAGVFSGLPALAALMLGNNPDTGDTLPLTVTVEKVGTDQARAKVLAGAPFAVDFTAAVANGSLAGGATTLGVAVGSVDGTPVTVTRTAGIMAAVTVDIDLTTQPTLPVVGHSGYEFVKAASGLPATILPAVANNAPVFSATSTTRTVEENSAAGTNVGAVIPEATDADSGDTLTYSMEGTDAASFAFDASTRQITTIMGVDYNYEATKNSYSVTVKADDGKGGGTATVDVTISLTNVDEGQSGTVTVGDTSPMVGDALTASAANEADPDGLPDPFAPAWQWYRTPAVGSETEIPGATSTAYTVVEADLGATLTAKASWTDKGGFANTLASAPTSAVAASDSARPTLSIADAEGNEAAGVEFTVTLSEAVADEVTATWTATIESGDTAEPEDFVDLSAATGTVMFEPGETRVLLRGDDVVDDALDEDDETFTVTLSNPTNATISGATAKATITDNDPTPTVTVAGGTATEGDKVEFVVTLSAVSGRDVEVDYATSVATGDDATSGTDFTAASGTLTIAAADNTATGTIEVQTTEDDASESAETVTLTLSNPDNATLTTVTTATGTINNRATAPTITSVAITSTPVLETDTYGAGETIEVSVTFSEAVTATSDTDFELNVSGDRSAPLLRGSGTRTLVFGYTVVSSDEDDNGIWIGDQDSTLVGARRLMAQSGTITSVASSTTADLTHAELGQQSDHKVDGSQTTGNNAPVFTSSASLSIEENTLTATVVAVDNDADDDITGYAITGGTDQDFFPEVTSAGVLTFNEAPNFEDPKDSGIDNTYVVTVEATSGTDTREMTATQTITVTVTDADEKSAKPDKPTLAKVMGSSTTLTATWAEPDLDGGPAIAGYDLQYREGTTGMWKDFAHTGTAVTTTIIGLTADTSYQVQVRAKNGETDSDWSDASDAVSTNAATPGTTPTLSIADAEGNEDEGVAFTVTLSATTTADVTATWTASIGSGDTAVAADLGATTTDMVTVEAGDTTAKFTVPVADDATDEDDETFTVTLSNASNATLSNGQTTLEVIGTIEDDDTRGVTVSKTEFTFREGREATYEVVLDTQPTGPLTVRVTVSGSPEVTAQPSSLWFTANDWSQPQSVTVRAAHDDDTVDDEATVTHAVAGADYGSNEVTAAPVSVSVEDDDTPSVTVSETAIEFREGGSATYTVMLDTQPSGPVTVRPSVRSVAGVTVSPSSLRFTPSVRGVAGVTVSPSQLMFTSSTWNRPQTVTVRAGQDDDDMFAVLTVGHAVTGADYDDVTVPVPSVVVTVNDDEAASTKVTLAVSPRTVREDAGATSLTVTAELDGAATTTATVVMLAAATSTDFEVRVDATPLTIPAGAVRATARMTLTPRDDDVDGPVETKTVTVSGTTTASLRVTEAEVTIVDDDTRALVVLVSPRTVPPTVLIGRNGEATYTVRLATQPRGGEDVMVSADLSAPPGVTVAPEEPLRFTADDWSEPQTVTVTVAPGTAYRDGETAAVVHEVSGTDYGSVPGGEVVVLLDPDAKLPREPGERLAPTAQEATQGWIARFGRTVTAQVLEAIEARLRARRAAGLRATLAGQALPAGDAGVGANDNASDRVPRADARDREAMATIGDLVAHAGAGDWRGDRTGGRYRSRTVTGRELLTGTSFALTGGSADSGGFAGVWGRGTLSRFEGRAGALTLDGEVATGLVGVDWAEGPGSGAGRWMAGLAVGHSRGAGGYRKDGCTDESCAGEVEATLTSVLPYAGVALTDRLSVWAAAGHGAGELRLMPGETDGPFTADLTMAMGAAGLRGEVLTPPPEGGLALAVKGDTRFTRTRSKATRDAGGSPLPAATGDVWLLRLGVEGSRRFAPGDNGAGMVLTPSFELGARLDGGDAETGLGVDLGGGLAFAAPKKGLSFDFKARGLIAHEAPGFREWGASASLTWDPRPETGRGLALSLVRSWGGSPSGGMNALPGRETPAGLGADDDAGATSAGRLEAELGYGLPTFGGGFTGTPNLGIGLTDTARDYRLGWRLTPARKGAPGFEIGLDATRREAANADAVHGLMLRGTVRW